MMSFNFAFVYQMRSKSFIVPTKALKQGLICLLILCSHVISAQNITTVAGNGNYGYSGEGVSATGSSIASPQGLAIDKSGNIFFSGDDHRIMKVSNDGVLTTIAGTGIKGSGQYGHLVYFDSPHGVALNGEGTSVYIADTYNHQIRVSGNEAGAGVYNFAGTGTASTDGDGDGSEAKDARLNTPYGVATDASNNVYILEQERFNSRVRVVDTWGFINTLAVLERDGYSDDESRSARGITVDRAGNLYVANGSRINKISAYGEVTTIAGNENQGYSGDGSLAINATLHTAGGIAVDNSGNIYFTDSYYNVVRKISTNGIITTVAGGGALGNVGDNGPAKDAYLNNPTAIAIDKAGDLYIAESGGNRIRKVDLPLSSNADLSNLGVSMLSYTFDPNVTYYSGNVIKEIQGVYVSPTVADAAATVKINGNSVESGSLTFVPLAVGKNTIPIVVTAQNGTTTKTYTVEVTRAAAPLSLSTSQTNVACYNGNTGSATVSVTGGATPYSYSWSPEGGTAATANNLKAGTYTVTVTDAQSQTATATVTITQPAAALAATSSKTNVSCNGGTNGSAGVDVSGGTAPYTYTWSGSNSTTASANNLPAGNYSVTVTDANNCTISRSFTITQPSALGATISKTDVTTAGGANGTATITVSGGTAPYAYAWSPQGGTADKATGLTAGTYTVTVTDANNCTISRSITITAPAAISTETTWLGTKSGDWHDAANWSNGVPTTALDVVIKPGTYMPDIPNNEPNPGYLARNLTIEAGATFNLKTILDLHGNLTNHGTFISYSNAYDDIYHTVSRVHVHKPATFGGTKPLAFYELWLENNATVNMATDVSVLYTLSLKSDLNTNGKKLTLLSQKWYTATVENAGGAVNGTAIVQRYIENSFNAGAGYRHFSSPVTNTTVADLSTAGFSPVVNAAYNTAEDPFAVKPFPTVLGYDQSRLSNASELKQKFDFGWYSPASTSSRLVPGMGYSVNIAASAKVDFVGTLNNEDVTVENLGRAATGAAGWHLLGNPYPSALVWSMLNKPAGMDDAIYVYRSSGQYAGTYISYVNGVGNDEANTIAAMQGFFVRVTSGPVDLTFGNYARSTYNEAKFYRTTTDERPQLQLELTNTAGLADDAFVYFQDGATLAADGKFDAFKVLTYNEDRPTLFSRVNQDALAIKGLPLENGVQSLPLEVYVPESGEYTFSVAKLKNFKDAAQVLLEDKETQEVYDLKQTAEVKLTLTSSTDPHRFVLRFSAMAGNPLSSGDLTAEDLQALVFPNPGKGNVNLVLNGLKSNSGKVQVTLYNSVGQVVFQQSFKASDVQSGVILPTAGLAKGIYHLQLQIAGKVISKKLLLQN